jgi:hypothetical protein
VLTAKTALRSDAIADIAAPAATPAIKTSIRPMETPFGMIA